MKTYILLFTLALFGLTHVGTAQTIAFSPDSVFLNSSEVEIPFELVAEGSVTNFTQNSITYNWEVVLDEFPTEWGVLYCDDNQCYQEGLLESPTPVILSTGQSGKMDLHVRPYDTEGTARVRVLVKVGQDVVATGFYEVVVDMTSNVKDVQVSHSVSLVPNPAVDGFYLDTDYADVSEVRIYNYIGEQVHTQPIRAGMFCDINHLQQGLYLVQALNSKGQALQTKRLIKK